MRRVAKDTCKLARCTGQRAGPDPYYQAPFYLDATMNRRSWLLMGLLAALWGASYLFIKVALEDGLDPIFIVFARIVLGALVLVPIAIRWGTWGSLSGRWPALDVMTLMTVVAPFLLITYGEQYIASSLTGILVAAAPIFTALLAVRYDQDERPRGVGAAGIVVGILGVALLFGVDLSGDAQALAGGLMVLLASFGYAVGGFYLKHRLAGIPAVGDRGRDDGRRDGHPGRAHAVRAAVAGAQRRGRRVAARARRRRHGLAFLIFYTLIADVGPTRASLVAYIAPAFAVVYGVWLLDEPLTAGAVLGLVLILGGSWLVAESRLPGRARVVPVAPVEAPPVREPA